MAPGAGTSVPFTSTIMRLGEDPGGVPKPKNAWNTPLPALLNMPKRLIDAPVVGAFMTRQPLFAFAAFAPVNSTPIHQPPKPAAALETVSRFRVTPDTAPVLTS